jgi:hypothetical protein
MGRWFRLDDDVVNDPKVQNLSDALFRAWVNILCIASKNDGVLPPLRDIAFTLRMKEAAAAGILSKLHLAGLLDKTETSFKPHNWEGRQFKSDRDATAAERSKRYRDGKRDRHASVTRDATQSSRPPYTESDTQTEAEKKETRASALVDDGWPSDFREQFWNRFPNKVGKPKALAKLEGCRRRGVAWTAIMSGLDRYIRDKPPDRAWLNPETFINQERWADQPAVTYEAAKSRPEGSLLAAIDRELDKVKREENADIAAPTYPVLSLSDGSIHRS